MAGNKLDPIKEPSKRKAWLYGQQAQTVQPILDGARIAATLDNYQLRKLSLAYLVGEACPRYEHHQLFAGAHGPANHYASF